jgi:hypothetical protein
LSALALSFVETNDRASSMYGAACFLSSASAASNSSRAFVCSPFAAYSLPSDMHSPNLPGSSCLTGSCFGTSATGTGVSTAFFGASSTKTGGCLLSTGLLLSPHAETRTTNRIEDRDEDRDFM